VPSESEDSRHPDREEYAEFWRGVGREFPSLKGARSTAYYRECEISICRQFFPNLAGARLFKTDLWDEAKNTEILAWLAGQGAEVSGIDLSLPTVAAARRVIGPRCQGLVRGDVRAIPFCDGAFDYIYSMGTVEHFPETTHAVAEIFRVLRPGGRAILGVPNRLDPFLRPLLARGLQALKLYDYGDERSYTPGQLRRLASEAGFRELGLSGVLFLPGWLRMLELLAHTRGWRRTARFCGALVIPFRAAYRRRPGVRRHGYLLALGVERPA
jgi:SAM-dependent methyltransferase